MECAAIAFYRFASPSQEFPVIYLILILDFFASTCICNNNITSGHSAGDALTRTNPNNSPFDSHVIRG